MRQTMKRVDVTVVETERAKLERPTELTISPVIHIGVGARMKMKNVIPVAGGVLVLTID
jgi:hypothetical protein